MQQVVVINGVVGVGGVDGGDGGRWEPDVDGCRRWAILVVNEIWR